MTTIQQLGVRLLAYIANYVETDDADWDYCEMLAALRFVELELAAKFHDQRIFLDVKPPPKPAPAETADDEESDDE